MSLRYYISLIEALAMVPPTEGPTTTPEDEQTIDDGVEASEPTDPSAPETRSQIMPAVR